MPSIKYKYLIFFKHAWIGVILISLFGISCGVRKVIPEGKQLLKLNKLVVNDGKVKSSELKAQILHRTNKRVLFNRLPVFLWIYALGTSNKHPELNDSIPWRIRFRDELGEAPVIYNEQLVKLANLVYKKDHSSTQTGLTDDDKDQLFDILKNE